MDTLQFRSYVFPSNPKEIILEQNQKIISHFCPGRGEILEPLGQLADRITCKGAFWGQTKAEAREQADNFLLQSKDQQAGLLFLPFGRPIYAYLQDFALQAEGDGKILAYTMVFVRDAL